MLMLFFADVQVQEDSVFRSPQCPMSKASAADTRQRTILFSFASMESHPHDFWEPVDPVDLTYSRLHASAQPSPPNVQPRICQLPLIHQYYALSSLRKFQHLVKRTNLLILFHLICFCFA